MVLAQRRERQRGVDPPGRPGQERRLGLFTFFAPDNWELLVKVLDGCAVNDRYWVFAAATTDVEVRLQVTDTGSGTVREYSSPLGSTAAITDTGTFASCP